MKLTKSQIEILSAGLFTPYARPLHLLCDGHRISLNVERSSNKTMQYRVMTYVDDVFKGAWISGTNSHPEQKYLRKVTRRVISPAKKAEYIKKLGKKRAQEWIGDMDRAYTLYYGDWPNAKAALNHLNKVCESVELALEDKA